MKRIEMIDKLTKRVERVELEYEGFENEEIENLKRWFADELVSEEWIEKGLADMDIENGFHLFDISAKAHAMFKFECIRREQQIIVSQKN